MDRLVLGGKNKATGRAEFVVGSWLVRRMVGENGWVVRLQAEPWLKEGAGWSGVSV